MPTTRVLQSRTSAECIKLSPQTADLLVPLGGQAQDLRPPTLWCAAVSLGAAAITWLAAVSDFIFDTPKTFGVCLGLFVLLAVPGAFLFWLYKMLHEVAQLPRQFQLSAQAVSTDPAPVATPIEGSVKDRSKAVWERVKNATTRRVQSALDFWALLECLGEVDSLGGPSRFLAFMANPISRILTGFAIVVSSLLVLSASFALVKFLFGLVF